MPWVIDRYDPSRGGRSRSSSRWGSVAAIGFAALFINTGVHIVFGAIDPGLRTFMTVCVEARALVRVLEGILFRIFCSFAASSTASRRSDHLRDVRRYRVRRDREHHYYARARFSPSQETRSQDVRHSPLPSRRGDIPLYTSMTGIGWRISRETLTKVGCVGRRLRPLRRHRPCSCTRHVEHRGNAVRVLAIIMLPLWFLVVFAFSRDIIWLCVRRREDHPRSPEGRGAPRQSVAVRARSRDVGVPVG
jgi:hypothetical protein